MSSEPVSVVGPPEGGAWSERHPGPAAWTYGLAYLGIALALSTLVGLISSQVLVYVLVLLGFVGTLLMALFMVLSISRLRMGARAEVGAVLLALLLFLLVRPLALAILARWLGIGAAGLALAKLLIWPEPVEQLQELVGNGLLIIWAAFLGRLVSRAVREGKLLLPVAVVAIIADFITVFHGLVAKASQEAPEVVQTFSTSAAVPPPEGVPVPPILMAVGIGDFLFIALFLSVALRYSMYATKAMWAVFVAMQIAPFAFFIWPDAPGIPGLPFIAVGVLGVNRRFLKFTREERRAMAVGAAVVGLATVVVLLMLRG